MAAYFLPKDPTQNPSVSLSAFNLDASRLISAGDATGCHAVDEALTHGADSSGRENHPGILKRISYQ